LALRLIPVTVASEERLLSNLKLIKNYLRNSKNENRPSVYLTNYRDNTVRTGYK
jgi:hypothetical protein